MKHESDASYMQTAGRALDILNCFVEGEPLSLTAISKRTGLSPSVTFRLLYTLTEHGFVKQLPEGKRYFVGDRAIILGLVGVNERRIVKAAHDLIWEWVRQTGYTITITSLIDGKAIVTARINTVQDERDMTRVGRAAPLHRGASQRTLLAYMEPAARDEYIDSLFIEKAGKDALRHDLETIRERGYDYTEGMLSKGVWAVSLPIFGHTGEIDSSITTSGNIGETTSEQIEECLGQLRRLQKRIQSKMDLE
jgi:DNA-binding IclR family transcriptional regulator